MLCRYLSQSAISKSRKLLSTPSTSKISSPMDMTSPYNKCNMEQHSPAYTHSNVLRCLEDIVDSGSEDDDNSIASYSFINCASYKLTGSSNYYVQEKNSLFLAILTAITFLNNKATFYGIPLSLSLSLSLSLYGTNLLCIYT